MSGSEHESESEDPIRRFLDGLGGRVRLYSDYLAGKYLKGEAKAVLDSHDKKLISTVAGAASDAIWEAETFASMAWEFGYPYAVEAKNGAEYYGVPTTIRGDPVKLSPCAVAARYFTRERIFAWDEEVMGGFTAKWDTRPCFHERCIRDVSLAEAQQLVYTFRVAWFDSKCSAVFEKAGITLKQETLALHLFDLKKWRSRLEAASETKDASEDEDDESDPKKTDEVYEWMLISLGLREDAEALAAAAALVEPV